MQGKTKLYARIFFVAVAATAIVGYAYGRTENLIWGPAITITEPENGATVSESLVRIAGTVENASFIAVNGRQAYADPEGRLTEELLLSYGYNVIEIEARDKFGRSVKNTIELVYK